MARKPKNTSSPGNRLDVDALRHNEAKRLNIPTAEFESVMREEDKSPVQIAYQRRNRDLEHFPIMLRRILRRRDNFDIRWV